MTCHEARERFSAVVDGALGAGERAAVDAHLAGCAECRRELERFRATVALVQGLPREQAPAGFAERVVAAARPAPWPRRAARALFVPWAQKLPLEAAAGLLIAGLAVLLFRGLPEQQRAASLEEPGTFAERGERAPRPEPRAQSDVGPREAPGVDATRPSAVPPPVAPAPSAESRTTERFVAPGESPAEQQAPVARQAPAAAQPPRTPPPAASQAPASRAPGAPQPPAGSQAPAGSPPPAAPPLRAAPQPPAASQAPAASRSRAPGSPPPDDTLADRQITAPSARGPAPSSNDARGPRADASAETEARAPAPKWEQGGAPPGEPAATGARTPPSAVRAVLAAADPVSAEQALSGLVSRLGGRVASTSVTGEGRLMALTVPGDRYAEFAREAARLGRWRPGTAGPETAAAISVVVTIVPAR